MIVWKRSGIFVPIIIMICVAIVKGITNLIMGPDFYVDSLIAQGISTILSSTSIWFLGRALNRNAKVVVCDSNNVEHIINNNHSFFYINFEYWAILNILFYIYMVVS